MRGCQVPVQGIHETGALGLASSLCERGRKGTLSISSPGLCSGHSVGDLGLGKLKFTPVGLWSPVTGVASFPSPGQEPQAIENPQPPSFILNIAELRAVPA